MSAEVIDAADIFCGAGGTSEGLIRAAEAAGLKLNLLAVNHWKVAIDTHQKNHPWARHVLSSVEALNPRDYFPSGRLRVLVASPECTDHSVAKGGRPKNAQGRASAWLILKWLQELYVDNLLIENVPEWEQWGPLGVDGKPLKSKRGETFQAFLSALRSLGYTVEYRILTCADYGDPTTRKRLFVIARRGRHHRITWPAQTHAPVGKTHQLFQTLKPWRPAREIIDWSLKGQSIFGRKRPLAPNTMKRILAGMEKFNWPEPFLVVMRNNMGARSLDDPMPTLTAGGKHIGLVEPFILGQQSDSAPRSTRDPIPTVSTAGAISLIEPFIIPQFSDHPAKSVDQPLGTLTTTSRGVGLVEPFIVPNFGEREGQAPRTHSVNDPLPTTTSHGAGCLVEPFLTTVNHGDPFVMKIDHQYDKARGSRSVEEPLPTLTTKNGLGVVEPFIVEIRKGKTANSVDRPLSTVTTMGAHHGLLEPFLVKYFGTGVSASVDDPLDTCTTKSRFGLIQISDTEYMDALFRMLQPHELAAGNGFPKSYHFVGTKSNATKLIGNAVPPGTAEALCRELIA